MKKFFPLFLLSAISAFGQGAVRRIDSIANLSAIKPLALAVDGKLSVEVSGVSAAGQYATRTLRWDSASTATVDNGCVYPVGVGGGRFIADDCAAGPINARWYGAGISTDSTAAIKAAINYAAATSFGGGKRRIVFLPSGTYTVSSTISVTNLVMILGEGIEANQVNTTDYDLNGAVINSTIADGTPVFKFVGTDLGGGDTYSQGWGIENIAIQGNGSEGSGIEFVGNSNFSDVSLRRIIIRGVGGSGIKVGDGTVSGSPRFGYLTWDNITILRPEGHGFEIYNETFYDVATKFTRLYVNGAGLSSFRFWNVGGFVADSWVENNSGQTGTGHGFDLLNVHGATFVNCVAEGNGRSDEAGSSYVPVSESLALSAKGVQNSKFINCIFTSSAGQSGTSGAGVVELISSTVGAGFGARESVNNTFEMCRINSFSPPLSAPSGATASGSGIEAGTHLYRVTATYSSGWETPLSAGGELAMVLTTATNVNLSSIPTASTLGSETVTGRKIYRTKANGSTFYLLATIPNNTTTIYSDTTADASLGSQAEPRYLVKLDADADLNEFDNTRFDVMPLMSDSGQWNYWRRWYVGTFNPDAMLGTGSGTWGTGPASGAQGRLHIFGADEDGSRQGWGITPGVQHSATLAVPGTSASRFNEPVGLLRADAGAASNVVALGRGGYGIYTPTHVELWSSDNVSAVATTNGIRHVTITSSGPVFNSPPAVENGEAYQLLDNTGTRRNGLTLDSGNILNVGYNGGRINIASGTGGIYLGGVGYSSPVYVVRQGVATVGSQLWDSQTLGFVASYWNGASETQVDGSWRLESLSTTPRYAMGLALAGSNRWRFYNDNWMEWQTNSTGASGSVNWPSANMGGLWFKSTGPSKVALIVRSPDGSDVQLGAGGVGGTNASTIFFNGAAVDAPNFTNSATTTFSVVGTNVTITSTPGVAVGAGTATRLASSGEIVTALQSGTNAVFGYVDYSLTGVKMATNNVADGDIWQYKASVGKWTNQPAPTGGGTTYAFTNGVTVSGTNVTANLLGAGGVTLTTNGTGAVVITGQVVTNAPVSELVKRVGYVDFDLVIDARTIGGPVTNTFLNIVTNGVCGTVWVSSVTNNSSNGHLTAGGPGVSVPINLPLYGVTGTNYWIGSERYAYYETTNKYYSTTGYEIVKAGLVATNAPLVISSWPASISYTVGVSYYTNHFRFEVYETAVAGGSGVGSLYVDSATVANARLVSNWAGRWSVSGTNITLLPAMATTNSATSIAPDFSLSKTHFITMSGNLTLLAPTNVVDAMVGEEFRIALIQDGTGSRTVTPATNYVFNQVITGIALATNANYRTYLKVLARSTSVFDVVGCVHGAP